MYVDKGGGGGETTHETYSIEDCQARNLNEDVLYADCIKKGKYNTDTEAIKSEIESTTEELVGKLAVIQAALLATNSNRYYSGEEATSFRQKLLDLEEDIVNLLDKIKVIYDNTLINDTIDQYNNDLPDLKKGAKLMLCQQYAEEINAKEEVKEEWDKTIANMPVDAYTVGWSNEVEESDNKYKLYYECTGYKDNTETGTRDFYFHYKRIIFINYWGWIKKGWWNGWPWTALDDDLAKLEQKLTEVGYPPKYKSQESRIIEPEDLSQG